MVLGKASGHCPHPVASPVFAAGDDAANFGVDGGESDESAHQGWIDSPQTPERLLDGPVVLDENSRDQPRPAIR